MKHLTVILLMLIIVRPNSTPIADCLLRSELKGMSPMKAAKGCYLAVKQLNHNPKRRSL